MTSRKRRARIGSFEALEDRVVLSQAANQAIVTDVTNFYSNLVSTLPALAASYAGASSGSTAQTTAATNLTNAITSDVNNLATSLLSSLGAGAAGSIKTSVTGSIAGGTTASDVTNTTGSASFGSLMNVLLAVNATDPAFLGTAAGLQFAGDISGGAAFALASAPSTFQTAAFGAFTPTYFNAVQPLAAQLADNQSAASTPPTTDQQTAINNDIAAIDATTVSNVNNLASNLVATTTTPAYTTPAAAIRQTISGSSATSGVTFTGAAGSTAGFGSLLATLQAIEADPKLLSNSGVISGIVSLFAFI